MSKITMASIGIAMMLLTAGAAGAQAPLPPFQQCPAIGADTSCAILFVATDDRIGCFDDPSQGPFDNIEDTLFGVQNDSTTELCSLTVNGRGIFELDGDGLCTFSSNPSCPFGPTGYEGPGTSFSKVDSDTGTVEFTPCLAPGESTYFSLEQRTSCEAINVCDNPGTHCPRPKTPEVLTLSHPAAELVIPFDSTQGKTSFVEVANLNGTSPDASQITTHWTFWSDTCDELADFSICLTLDDSVVVDPRAIRALGPDNEALGPLINLDGKRGIITVTAYETDRSCSDFRQSAKLKDDAIVGLWTIADTDVGYSFGQDALGFGTDDPSAPTRIVLPAVSAGDRFVLQAFNPSSVEASRVILTHLRSPQRGPVVPVKDSLVLSVSFVDSLEIPVSLPDVQVVCTLFTTVAQGLIPGFTSVNSSGTINLRAISGLGAQDALVSVVGQAVGRYGAVSNLKRVSD